MPVAAFGGERGWGYDGVLLYTPHPSYGSPNDMKAFIDACVANSGPGLGFIDTVSTAKDMDVLRALMGDSKLNYLGFSYGTYMGATYAALFADRVGRMVLDGAIDLASALTALKVTRTSRDR